MSTTTWTPEMEVSLFYAMIDHKPVGENKHFHMIFIYEKFNNLSEKKLTIEQIWQHLNTLYDLQALDENEIMSFPNDESDFFINDFEEAASQAEPQTDQTKNTPAPTTTKTSEITRSKTSSSRTSTSANKSSSAKKNR